MDQVKNLPQSRTIGTNNFLPTDHQGSKVVVAVVIVVLTWLQHNENTTDPGTVVDLGPLAIRQDKKGRLQHNHGIDERLVGDDWWALSLLVMA